jgi:hypothetical protein
METEDHPRDAIFIKWGRFQIGAFGRLAILTILLLVILIFLGRSMSLW